MKNQDDSLSDWLTKVAVSLAAFALLVWVAYRTFFVF